MNLQKELDSKILEKIKFDLSLISPEGLIGQPDSLRSLIYEFCVFNRKDTLKEVTLINPNLQIFPKSPGRIGCQPDEVLCLGDTHHPRWKEILINLARLDYIKTIQQSYGE